MKMVGFTGFAGSGKNYLAGILADDLYMTYITAGDDEWWANGVEVAFARGVRQEIEEVLGVKAPVLYEKPTPPEVRRLLQWWGTDLRREQDPDYWIKYFDDRVRSHADETVPHPVLLITDVRFPNEVQYIHDNGGLVVRVSASLETRAARLERTVEQVEQQSLHPSESGIMDLAADIEIDNDEDGAGHLRVVLDWLRATA